MAERQSIDDAMRRRFVVASAAILPSRLLLLVELFFQSSYLRYPRLKQKNTRKGHFFCFNGGEAEIRTLGGVAPSTVFKTAALNRSATSPFWVSIGNTKVYLLKISSKVKYFL